MPISFDVLAPPVLFQIGNGPQISSVADNRADYPSSLVPARSKLEIACQIVTVATVPGWRYDAAPPSGVVAGIGISVSLEDTNDNWVTTNTQPMVRRPVMTYNVYGGFDHYYPTGAYEWIGRVSPPYAARGARKYRIRATDSGGTTLSPDVAFTVVAPLAGAKGFIRVAQADDRYYERENGDLVPGFGYNLATLLGSMPTTRSAVSSLFAQLGANKTPLIRWWAGTQGLWGAAENRWYGNPGSNGKERIFGVAAEGLTADVGSNSNLVWKMENNEIGYPGSRGINAGFALVPPLAVLPDTVYRVEVRYLLPTSLVSNDANPFGLCVKTGGFPTNADVTGTGTLLKDNSDGVSGSAVHASAATPTWATLTAYLKTGSSQRFLTGNGAYVWIVLENCSTGSGGQLCYIDNIRICEQATGTDILFRSDADMDREVDEPVARAYDWVVSEAEANGVALQPILWMGGAERTSVVFGDETGNLSFGPADLSMDRTRWRFSNLWRLWGARWAYSDAIFALELTNEGNWNYAPHAYSTRLMGEETQSYWSHHLFKTSCTTEHENTFWTETHAPIRDNHQYMAEWTIAKYITYSSVPMTPGPTQAFLFAGPGSGGAPNKWRSGYPCYHDIGDNLGPRGLHGLPGPIMVGETGINVLFDPLDPTDGVYTDVSQTMTASAHDIKLHKIGWGTSLHKSGIGLLWWFTQAEVYDYLDGSPNRLPIWKRVVDFLAGVPLNNGHYVDAAATGSHADMVCVGQKDLTNKTAAIWVDHRQHTWYAVDAGTPVTPIVAPTVTVPGMAAGQWYTATVRDTYSSSLAVLTTQTVQANGSGVLTISAPTLSTDYVLTLAPTSDPGGGSVASIPRRRLGLGLGLGI